MSDADQPKKIIIDEDWKSQVEREREQMRESPLDTGAPGAETSDPAASSDDMPELPAASFGLLISEIATQAMICLGQIPDPVENQQVLRLDIAKHHIDMLSVLEEKTRGNLDPAEAEALQQVTHQLRMVYVQLS